ncbi:hypothetical protein [Neptunicella sp.]|uniref:hypothetical protein n=1 Tax=Neptunicella sp. TaxID=2125986 RepID=UPI003F68BFF0
MKASSSNGQKLFTAHGQGSASRRQAYYKGKYKREIFYIGLSLLLIVIAAGLSV